MNQIDIVRIRNQYSQNSAVDTRKFDRRALLKASGALGLAGAVFVGGGSFFSGARAQDEEGGGMPPLPEGATVVGQGLWNPGNLTLGADGTLYIAEQGIAGGGMDGPSVATPGPDGSPIPAAPPLVAPQISAVAPDGAQAVLTTAAGGVGIGIHEQTLYVSAGGGSVGSGFAPLPVENTVSAVDIMSGEAQVVAELGPYEEANNPDGTDINPNLYGLGVAPDGTVYVADAGGNTIYQIDPASGEFSLFAVVPNLTDLTGSTPTPEEEAMQPGPRQPVPTSVAIAPDGTITVVLLSEMWNGPSILDYQADGTYAVRETEPLSMIVNATYGPDGLLYVSQLTADFSGEMPAPGAVYRVEADGVVTPVVEGLFFPHGIAFAPASGNLFVVTNSIISGPDAPLGMVVRIDDVATVA
ncbi:MAG: ScyD/ScyE family protein [Thermomicrobiales bacterium]|nr:ScyD/ScyE family protein [Thermomicrobiales bacterium]